jgi:MFS family permease
MSADARLLIAGQGVRAAGYGLTSVVLGALLAARDYGPVATGILLTTLVAGAAAGSAVIGLVGDRTGRRLCYGLFFLLVAVAGGLVAAGAPMWLLLVVGLTGALSTDVVDNGPATTLEQVMLAAEDNGTARVYGRYNAIGALCGAAGALGAAAAGLGAPHGAASAMLFLGLVPVGVAGAWIATRLSAAVEAASAGGEAPQQVRLGVSRHDVRRLGALFAIDAGGGGLVTTAFLSYYFTERFHVPLSVLGWLFSAVTVVQAVSVAAAPRLARRFGLVPTMVWTHLPSNVLLAAVAFVPTFAIAAVLLLGRTTLSQMDVPTRQALVMTVVTPPERTTAAAVTNGARYAVRPLGPVLAGILQQFAVGAPLLVAGLVKGGYDLALWRWARRRGVGGPQVLQLAGPEATA